MARAERGGTGKIRISIKYQDRDGHTNWTRSSLTDVSSDWTRVVQIPVVPETMAPIAVSYSIEHGSAAIEFANPRCWRSSGIVTAQYTPYPSKSYLESQIAALEDAKSS